MKSNKKRSQKQERKLAEKTGGRVRPASGALWHAKGDVKTDKVLFEAKITKHKQYPLKLEILRQIEGQALGEDRMPALQITFEKAGRHYVVISLDDFIALLEGEFDG